MDKLPQRDDLIYKEIEEFQDYELTECIAYEMAIRTQLVKEYFNLTQKDMIINEITELYELENQILNECWLHHKDVYSEHNEKYNMTNEMSSHINNKTCFSIITDLDYNEISVIDNNQLSRKAYKTTFRPLLSIPKEYKNDITVQINFNLPKKEITAYIEKLKDFNDNKFSIGMSPKTIISDEIMKYINPIFRGTGKADSLQKRWADWFYIYDYWKYEKTQGKTDKDVFVNLVVENDVSYKEDNLRKIRDKMKYFIDDLGYKELITGVKNT